MMPQREVDDSFHEQTEPTYGRYEGEQVSARQHYETSYEQAPGGLSAKVYPMPRDNKNMYSFAIFVISIALLLFFALLAIFVIGGTGGWVSLIVIASIIFLLAVVVIDKMK
jgi:amino acid transporter